MKTVLLITSLEYSLIILLNLSLLLKGVLENKHMIDSKTTKD